MERGRRDGSHAGRNEYLRALSGIEFPAAKDGIVRKAQDVGGLDSEVHYVLDRIDARTHGSLDELLVEVERVYASGVRLEGPAPAAPAPPGVKDAASQTADTRRGEPGA